MAVCVENEKTRQLSVHAAYLIIRDDITPTASFLIKCLSYIVIRQKTIVATMLFTRDEIFREFLAKLVGIKLLPLVFHAVLYIWLRQQ